MTTIDTTFESTILRQSDVYVSGWHCVFANNCDSVRAWRSDGGCVMEAEGVIEGGAFVPARMRIVSGAVDFHSGEPLQCPRPWI